MSRISISLACVLVFHLFSALCVDPPDNEDFKSLRIPLFGTCDIGDDTGLNRNWMEGYYTPKGSYIRVYMSVFDIKGYPNFKDFWQDNSGHIVIHNPDKLLWIGFGRPGRQIVFANKYIEDGKKAKVQNEPLIGSFLVKAETITDISKGAFSEQMHPPRELDLNVDTKNPNQFGLGAVSTELLRQNALTHSMVTYYLITKKDQKPWGKTENVAVLDQSVTYNNMRRELPKDCEWTYQDLFPIEQDIAFQDKVINLNDAIEESAKYKQLLIERMVLLSLIEEMKVFFQIGGPPYNAIKDEFDKNVVNSPKLTEKFERGEDLTQNDLDTVRNTLVAEVKANRKPSGVDDAPWERFSSSVDQVGEFARFSNTEIKIGNQDNLIKEWDVLQNYKVFEMSSDLDPLPRMQLIQDSGNIGIRMNKDGEDVIKICQVIKNNFIGSLVGNIRLISPLHDHITIYSYAKRLSDCLAQKGAMYMERSIQATVVTIYGADSQEYRFYPDVQVASSEHIRGTVLLFENGAAVNLCIKGYVFALTRILDRSLQSELKPLQQDINDKQKNKADGLVIVPQKFVKWPQPKKKQDTC